MPLIIKEFMLSYAAERKNKAITEVDECQISRTYFEDSYAQLFFYLGVLYKQYSRLQNEYGNIPLHKKSSPLVHLMPLSIV